MVVGRTRSTTGNQSESGGNRGITPPCVFSRERSVGGSPFTGNTFEPYALFLSLFDDWNGLHDRPQLCCYPQPGPSGEAWLCWYVLVIST